MRPFRSHIVGSHVNVVHPSQGGGREPLGLLHAVPPFASLAPRDLAPLGPHVDHLRVPAGTVLARAGETGHQVVVVVDGQVEVRAEGDRVDLVGPGAVIGADAVTDRIPYGHDYVVGEDADVLVLSGPAYRWVAPLVAA